MRYLCFLLTHDDRQYRLTVEANNGDQAMNKTEDYARRVHGVRDADIACVAGVWERDHKFYTAQTIYDLDSQE